MSHLPCCLQLFNLFSPSTPFPTSHTSSSSPRSSPFHHSSSSSIVRVIIRKAADTDKHNSEHLIYKSSSPLLSSPLLPSPLVSYLYCGPMRVQVPAYEALVQLSVTLKISCGWSLYPRVTACHWSGSSLPPCNPTHWAPARPYGYHALLNMFVSVRRSLKLSVAVFLLNLLVPSSYRFPVRTDNKEEIMLL